MNGVVLQDAAAPLVTVGPDYAFVGASEVIRQIKIAAARVAMRPSTVMIHGQTGTGKEMLARFIHEHSARANKPFIPVDCTALSESLFESQLFGHTKDAFTGAMRDTLGFIRAADGGTLFLDEVGELPLALQAKFLRVIQERLVVPLGGVDPHPVDFRLIVATNRDLDELSAQGKFRADLLFRIEVIILTLPPLCDRSDDILPLANHFLARLASFAGKAPKRLADPAQAALVNYPWPGNIRELFNVLEHADVMCEGAQIELTDLPGRLAEGGDDISPSDPATPDLNLTHQERQLILQALNQTQYKRGAAAKLLGIERRRLNRMILAHKIDIAAGKRQCRVKKKV